MIEFDNDFGKSRAPPKEIRVAETAGRDAAGLLHLVTISENPRRSEDTRTRRNHHGRIRERAVGDGKPRREAPRRVVPESRRQPPRPRRDRPPGFPLSRRVAMEP